MNAVVVLCHYDIFLPPDALENPRGRFCFLGILGSGADFRESSGWRSFARVSPGMKKVFCILHNAG